MKKNYIEPQIKKEEIELEDIMATSGFLGGILPGDEGVDWDELFK